MKFSKSLKNVNIWNHHYIPYQKLKRKLRNMFSPPVSPLNNGERASSGGMLTPPVQQVHADPFLSLLQSEIAKVNSFMLDEKLPMISGRFSDLLEKYTSIDFTSPFSVSLGLSVMSPQIGLGSSLSSPPIQSMASPTMSQQVSLDQSSSSLGFFSEQQQSTLVEVDTITALQIGMEDILKQLAELDQFSKLNVQAIQKLLSSYSKMKIKSLSTNRRKTSIPETFLNKEQHASPISNGHSNSGEHTPTTSIKDTCDRFINDHVKPLELYQGNLIKKLTLEIEIEYQSICQSSSNILNNSYLALLNNKEKELSNRVSLFCQNIVNNNINDVELILKDIYSLMKELNISDDQIMWVKTIHYCIHKSCFLGNLEIIRFLFDRFKSMVNIHYSDEKNKQFIHIAAENGHDRVITFLLEQGADIECNDFLSRKPIHLSAKGNHFESVSLLISKAAEINSLDREGCTPLFLACRSNRSNSRVIQLLLKSGATLRPGPYGRSPVHELASKGILENLSIFLDHFKENKEITVASLVNSSDWFGRTPIFEAVKHCHLDCLSLLLLEPSISLETGDEEKRTPIHEAVANGKKSALDMMIYHLQRDSNQTKENLARIMNLQDDDGWSAVHDAAFYNYTECVKVLLEKGGNPFLLDKGEWSPIVHCLYRGNIKTALVIMEFLKQNPELIAANELNTPSLKDSRNSISSPQQPPKFDLLSQYNLNTINNTIVQNSGHLLSATNIASPVSTLSSSSSSSVSSTGSFSSISTPTSSTNKTKKIPKNLMSTVSFKISVPNLKPGYSVGMVGNRKAIGSWNPSSALMFRDESNDTWIGKVQVPVNIQLEYKYVIFDGQRLDSWETLPENRKFTPQEENEFIDDGFYGSNITDEQPQFSASPNNNAVNQSTVFIEKGWLVQDTQIRLRFGETTCFDPQRKIVQPVLLYNGKEQAGRIVVTLRDRSGQSVTCINNQDSVILPISKDHSVIIQTNQITPYQTIQLEVFRRGMSSVSIGKAIFLISDIIGPNPPFKKTIPVVNSSFVPVGEISFFPLVILPFSHPKLSDVLSKTYWKSTLLIGHRGGGAENSRSVGKYKRTHIKENTILSFVTAASLGAQYIEFDVQLSRDLVPVIYHDFEIETKEKLKIPVNKLDSDYFKQNKQNMIKNKHQEDQEKLTPQSLNGSGGGIPLAQSRNRSKSMQDIYEDLSKGLSLSTSSFFKPINESESQSQNNSPHSIQGKSHHKSDHSTQKSEEELLSDSLATLEETFKKVPIQCGFNIEIKYPSLEREQELKLNCLNRNDYVDIILKVVFEHAGERAIIFSSFDPDICILTSVKQPKYPVFFLSSAGITQHSDPRCNSIYEAIRFSKASHCLGIVTNSKILVEGPPIISQIKSNGLMLVSWGTENNDPTYCDLQETLGCDALIVDHVAYVSKHSNNLSNKNNITL